MSPRFGGRRVPGGVETLNALRAGPGLLAEVTSARLERLLDRAVNVVVLNVGRLGLPLLGSLLRDAVSLVFEVHLDTVGYPRRRTPPSMPARPSFG